MMSLRTARLPRGRAEKCSIRSFIRVVAIRLAAEGRLDRSKPLSFGPWPSRRAEGRCAIATALGVPDALFETRYRGAVDLVFG